MFIMYVGSLSLVTGLFYEIGCLGLIVFSILGTRVHLISMNLAIKNMTDETRAIGFSAYGAHLSSALKNVGLIVGLAVIFLCGPGSWSL